MLGTTQYVTRFSWSGSFNGRDAIGMYPGVLEGLCHMDLDMSISCDNRRNDYLGESRRRTSLTVSSHIRGLVLPRAVSIVPAVSRVFAKLCIRGFDGQVRPPTLLSNSCWTFWYHSGRVHNENAFSNGMSYRSWQEHWKECLNRFTLTNHKL